MGFIKKALFVVSFSALLVGTASATNFGLQFNGISDYVQCTTGTAQALTSNFTLEAWVQTTTSTGAHRILSNWQDNPSRGWGFGIKDTAWRFTTFGVKDYDTSPGSVIKNKWNHIAVSFDSANTSTFYVNGTLAGTIGFATACRESTAALCIGVNAAKTEYWEGAIDEVRVWNTVRSASEISANWAHPLVGNEPGLVFYHALNEGVGLTTADVMFPTGPSTISGAQWRIGTPFDPNTPAKDWSLFQ